MYKYMFSYHSAKLTFGLVLFEFNDAVKEGDGGRLFHLYKLASLQGEVDNTIDFFQ